MGWGTKGVGGLAAAGALGLLVGAYFVGVFGHHFDLKNIILACFIVLGGALAIFPFLNNILLFLLVIFIGGIAMSPVFIGQDTLIHHHADEFIRGRMFSIRDWILNCSFVVGALIIGFLATLMKKDFIFIISGIVLAILAIFGWFILARVKSR
jgi:MFS family permease